MNIQTHTQPASADHTEALNYLLSQREYFGNANVDTKQNMHVKMMSHLTAARSLYY